LADVALIGLPNAGKSTLISAISAARPKIADYPFTTLIPNLGVVRLDASRHFVVADIPGLIRGASQGAGLGHQFLKHIERAPIFIHLLDAGQHLEGSQSLFRHFMSLNRELKIWNEELVERPQLIAITKLDTIGGNDEAQAEVERTVARLQARGCEVFEISAATGHGLQPLLERVWQLVEEARALQQEEDNLPPMEITRVQGDKPFTVKEIARYADGMSEWEASGGILERLINRFDLNNHEALLHVHRMLERNGVIEELRKAGVKPGDLVHVGKMAFEFEE
jgi:GTP-binding protein